MKIRILKVTNQFPLTGVEIQIDDTVAAELIATGIAESAEEAPPEPVTPPPIETADASEPTERQRPQDEDNE